MNRIVFVVQIMKPRILKLAYGLGCHGYSVDLLMHKAALEGFSENDKKYFNNIKIFNNKDDLFDLCVDYKNSIFHVFVEYIVPTSAKYIIERKSELGKMIYDPYDGCRDMAITFNKESIDFEKYCLENADGICARSFETQHLKMKYKYKFRGKRLFFPDYCWGVSINNERVDKNEKDDLKIVYGGRLLSPLEDLGSGRMEWNAVKHIVKVCESSEASFTIVPYKNYGILFDCYKRLARNSKAFYLKNHMCVEDLLDFENQMDFGTDTFEFSEAEDDRKVYRDYSVKARYSATNKYFDFIDAEIPFIYGKKGEMFGRYFEKYFGCACKCTLEELPEKINELKEKKAYYRENAKRAKEQLSIKNQIPRLIEFYQSI